MSTINAPSPRDTHTTIWTGSEMIVFGGGYGETFNTGGRYDPTSDTWTPIRTTNTPATDTWKPSTLTNAPERRRWHSAVWTGSEMIVWGGEVPGITPTNTGARYNPNTDTWIATNIANTPDPRIYHTAVWTGSQMI